MGRSTGIRSVVACLAPGGFAMSLLRTSTLLVTAGCPRHPRRDAQRHASVPRPRPRAGVRPASSAPSARRRATRASGARRSTGCARGRSRARPPARRVPAHARRPSAAARAADRPGRVRPARARRPGGASRRARTPRRSTRRPPRCPAAVGDPWEPVGTTPLVADDPRFGQVNGEGLADLNGRVADFAYDAAGDRVFAAVGEGGVWESDRPRRALALDRRLAADPGRRRHRLQPTGRS